MAKKKAKYYVVWHGLEPGIYDDWTTCEAQVKGVEGAKYKAFDTAEEAEEAFYSDPSVYMRPTKAPAAAPSVKSAPASPKSAPAAPQPAPSAARPTVNPAALPAAVVRDALAVDAACAGNPGKMEYRGVYLKTGEEIFHFGPVYGTNNIGEFLAIVHALALLKQQGRVLTVYTDSQTALTWIRLRHCKTQLANTPRTADLHNLIARAERWLQTNTFAEIPLKKWDTAKWGEIPADFGRK